MNAHILFDPAYAVLSVDLDPGESLIIQSASYLASTTQVDIDTSFQALRPDSPPGGSPWP